MPIIIGANTTAVGAYSVANSANFESANSQALSKDYSGTHSDANQGTWSMWIKRAKLTTRMKVFGAYITGNDSGQNLEFQADDTMRYRAGSGSSDINTTTAVYRDPAAWMHVVIQQDSDEGSASNQVKIWVNNTLQTLSTNNGAPGLIQFGHADAAANSIIGAEESAGNSTYFDGYMAEFAYCDGQKLDPTSFGEYDEDSPTIWKPKNLSGLTFGNQGVWLDFGTSGTMGNDVSGNNNDFGTEDNAVEQKTDTPTNNFATLNPLVTINGSTFSEGNCKIVTGSSPYSYDVSTIAVTAGKWYVEALYGGDSDDATFGIAGRIATTTTHELGQYDDTWSYYTGTSASNIRNNNSNSSYGDTYEADDVIGLAVDLTNNKLYFSKNGTWQNSGDPESGGTGTGAVDITAVASVTDGVYYIGIGDFDGGASVTWEINFGNPSFTISSGNADADGYGNFEYAVPSGYYALCTKNLGAYGG